ncbi:Disrupted in schizophrenia 1 protein [Plecturocebus cupreus]
MTFKPRDVLQMHFQPGQQPGLLTTCSVLSEAAARTETGLREKLDRARDRLPFPSSGHTVPGPGKVCLDPRGLLVGNPVSESTAAPAVTSVRGTSAHFGIQLRGGTRLPDRLSRPCGPGNAGRQQEFSAMDSSETLDASWEAACSEGAGSTRAAGCLPSAELMPLPQALALFGSRLVLPGNVEKQKAARHPERPSPLPEHLGDGSQNHQLGRASRRPSMPPSAFSLLATRVLADSAQAAGNSSRPEGETHSLWDMDLGSSGSPDPSLAGCGGDGSGDLGDAHSWDALLRKWEPAC